MSNIVKSIRDRAKKSIKTIVLAEGEERRTVEAAKIAVEEGFARIILLGREDKISDLAKETGLEINTVKIIDPAKSADINRYADLLYNLRKRKGMNERTALETALNPLYFGTLMVKAGDADGMVCGAITSSADVMRSALQIIKTAPDTKLVSTAFIMNIERDDGQSSIFAFADCVVNVNPTAREAADIAITTAHTFEQFVGEEPRVAMLSYTTYGMDTGKVLKKMQEAAYIAKRQRPSLQIDGEMQLDAAIDESVAKIKIKNSAVGGRANVLIFPDLNSGNICYKIVQRLCGAEVIGPIIQGLAKPVNDLSRGCVPEEIANVIAITAIQAAQCECAKK